MINTLIAKVNWFSSVYDRMILCLGCSAAVLALKYGHIECANQITHRDWDEFFVIPRPLSIYETPPLTEDNQTTTTEVTTIPKKNSKRTFYHSSSNKTEIRPSTLSFGLLKIIFNDSDTGYSTRLASLCQQDKQIQHRHHLKLKKQEALQTLTTTINKSDRTKSTVANSNPHYCSTEALVNETQSSSIMKEHRTNLDNNGKLNKSNRTSPRLQLLMHQQQQLSTKTDSKDNNSSFIQKTNSKSQLSTDDINKSKSSSLKSDGEDIKSKISIATMYRQSSHSTLNHSENNSSNKFHRPTTAMVRHQTFAPPPSSLSSTKINSTHIPSSASTKKKTLLNSRIDSASNISKQQSTANSAGVHATRSISSAAHHFPCSIREVKGKGTRFNNPEELFGLRPEELFCSDQYQPKILDQRSTTKPNDNTRLKRQQQQHIWQQDVDRIIELYNIHHCANYRKSAVPPPIISTHGVSYTDTFTDLSQGSRSRRMSITKTPATNSKPSPTSKQSTFAGLSIPRRNSISRPSIKLTNT